MLKAKGIITEKEYNTMMGIEDIETTAYFSNPVIDDEVCIKPMRDFVKQYLGLEGEELFNFNNCEDDVAEKAQGPDFKSDGIGHFWSKKITKAVVRFYNGKPVVTYESISDRPKPIIRMGLGIALVPVDTENTKMMPFEGGK